MSIAGGIAVVPAPGWEVVDQDSQSVTLLKRSAGLFEVVAGNGGDQSADALLNDIVREVLSTRLETVKAQVKSVEPPKANIVSAAYGAYSGTLASQQGSTAVEGFLFTAIRQDGVAVVVITTTGEGEYDTNTPEWGDMLDSILESL